MKDDPTPPNGVQVFAGEGYVPGHTATGHSGNRKDDDQGYDVRSNVAYDPSPVHKCHLPAKHGGAHESFTGKSWDRRP